MSDQQPTDDVSKESLTGKQAYNLVTDTVAGPNLRLRDNLYQGLAILVGLFLGAGIGLLPYGLPGAMIGGFIGVVLGLFGSGIFLMIYRGIKHRRGEHD